MQAQKEAPADMQCKDKFLLQCVVASPGATPKDVTHEMVFIDIVYYLSTFWFGSFGYLAMFYCVMNTAV